MSKQDLIDTLTMAGAKFKGTSCTCPFHKDKNPSAGIYQASTQNWRFKCQVCDYNFDNIGVKAKLTGKTPEEILAEENGGKTVKTFSESQIRSMFSPERGFKYLHEYKNEKGNITHMVAIKYNQNGSKDVKQISSYGFSFRLGNSGQRPLFNLDEFKNNDRVILVEGEKCCKALNYIGFFASTCMGGASSVSKCDLSPLKGKEVIIWPDNDDSGTKYAKELKESLKKIGVESGILKLDDLGLENKEDAADYISKALNDNFKATEIKEEIEDILHSCKISDPLDDFFINHRKHLNSGILRSVKIGWPALELTGWMNGGAITIVCAAPGSGKSWFVHNLAVKCLEQNIPVSNIQLEDSKNSHLCRGVRSKFGINLGDPDSFNDSDFNKLREVDKDCRFTKKINDSLIKPEGEDFKLLNILRKIEEQIKLGDKIIIVDSVSIAEKGSKMWEDDAKFCNGLNELCQKNLDVRVILVTHPKSGMSKELSMDSISGGQSYQRMSHTIFYIRSIEKANRAFTINGFMDKSECNSEIVILKARNSKSGLDSSRVLFDFSNAKFNELGFVAKV